MSSVPLRPQSISVAGPGGAGFLRSNGSGPNGPFNKGFVVPENHHGTEKGMNRQNQSCSNLNGWGYLAAAIPPGNYNYLGLYQISYLHTQCVPINTFSMISEFFSILGSNCGRLPSAPATPHLHHPTTHPNSTSVVNAACSANNRELQSILKEVGKRLIESEIETR